MIKLRKQIFRDELRCLCIRKDWYTCGDIKSYDNMFNRLSKNMADNEILEVAKDIYDNTDIFKIQCEYGASEDDVFDNIVYELFEIVHTFVER